MVSASILLLIICSETLFLPTFVVDYVTSWHLVLPRNIDRNLICFLCWIWCLKTACLFCPILYRIIWDVMVYILLLLLIVFKCGSTPFLLFLFSSSALRNTQLRNVKRRTHSKIRMSQFYVFFVAGLWRVAFDDRESKQIKYGAFHS